MKCLFLLALLLPLTAGAQVQKCTIEGKTVYSDSLCGQGGETINATVNSLDTSGMRDQVAKREKQESAEKAKAVAANKGKPRNFLSHCDAMKPAGVVPTAAEADRRLSCIRNASKGHSRQ